MGGCGPAGGVVRGYYRRCEPVLRLEGPGRPNRRSPARRFRGCGRLVAMSGRAPDPGCRSPVRHGHHPPGFGRTSRSGTHRGDAEQHCTDGAAQSKPAHPLPLQSAEPEPPIFVGRVGVGKGPVHLRPLRANSPLRWCGRVRPRLRVPTFGTSSGAHNREVMTEQITRAIRLGLGSPELIVVASASAAGTPPCSSRRSSRCAHGSGASTTGRLLKPRPATVYRDAQRTSRSRQWWPMTVPCETTTSSS